MEAYNSFFPDASSQQTSTPKFDREHVQHKLFSADESSILSVSSEPKIVQETVQEVVHQKTYKRRLFHDGLPESKAGRAEGARKNPLALKGKRSADGEQKDRPADEAKDTPARSAPSDIPRVDPKGKNWSAAQQEAFFAAVQEHGTDFGSVEGKMAKLLLSQYGPKVYSKSLPSVVSYADYIFSLVSDAVDFPKWLAERQNEKEAQNGREKKLWSELDRRVYEEEIRVYTEAFKVYALINFGVWNKNLGSDGCTREKNLLGKLRPVIKDKTAFKQLFDYGECGTSLPRKASTPKPQAAQPCALPEIIRMKTFECGAFRRLHLCDGSSRIPCVIPVHLRPRTSATWNSVVRSKRSPVLTVNLSRAHNIKKLHDLLRLYWFIDRQESRYRNSDEVDLILRPPMDLTVHWPNVMPDFDVLVGIRYYNWLSYQFYAKAVAVQKAAAALNLSPVKSVVKNEPVVMDDDENAMDAFHPKSESDDEDSTITPGTPVKPKTRAAVSSREVHKKHYHGDEIMWTSKETRQLNITVGEVFLIAGGEGELTLDYDWIVPDNEALPHLPLDSLCSRKRSDLFYEAMSLPNPRKVPPLVPEPDPVSAPVRDAPVPVLPSTTASSSASSVTAIQLAPLISPSSPEVICDSGPTAGSAMVFGDTLSEFILPSQPAVVQDSAQQYISVVSQETYGQGSSALPFQYISQPAVQPQIYSTTQLQTSHSHQGYFMLSNGQLIQIAPGPQQVFQQQAAFPQTYVINNSSAISGQQQGFVFNGSAVQQNPASYLYNGHLVQQCGSPGLSPVTVQTVASNVSNSSPVLIRAASVERKTASTTRSAQPGNAKGRPKKVRQQSTSSILNALLPKGSAL